MFAGSLLFVVWLLAQDFFVFAQTSNATCAVSHNWAFNSQKQSPCVVAATLLAVCTGSYEVDALPLQFHYDGPDTQDANQCQCNTVVYSLLAECGLCQSRTITMWSLWETNCASVSINSFPLPLPAGLHVPGWAYLDVKTADMFNETLALANANVTESTAIPLPSKTSSVPKSTSSASVSSAAAQPSLASDTSDSPSPVNQKRNNAIGGGIVGGVAALGLVCSLVFWIYRRRRIAQTNGEVLNSPAMSQHRTDTLASHPSQPTLPMPSITVSSLNLQPGSGSIRSAV
ncbi:hypothetical protein C8F04DRAFT_1062418 [Mycena alexandri]|uniref:Uncharacterized protein n=1 Tax=Mycena alexandri TaxID=1745969 RepID=A0AAD6TI24_9AGAR|nr:hypothetical protein C8F04DRAFT_1062418 [Mycena alexandri]